MKLAIIYSSRTGNTKRLAEGIHKNAVDSKIYDINSYVEEKSDCYLVCCWIDKAKPDALTLEKIDAFNGKNVYVMATLGAYVDSEYGKNCIKNITELYKDCNLLGVKLVQGSVSNDMIEMFKKLPKDHVHALTKEKMMRYEAIKDRPREDDVEDACNWLSIKLEELNA